eukprot:5823704-Amphidinium_carterae.1
MLTNIATTTATTTTNKVLWGIGESDVSLENLVLHATGDLVRTPFRQNETPCTAQNCRDSPCQN